GRAVERLDRAHLANGVVAPEQRFRVAAHGRTEVFDLQEVAVDILDVDALAVELDVRVAAAHRVRHDELALGADRLEPVSLRKVEPAVNPPEAVVRNPQPPDKPDVAPPAAQALAPEDELRLPPQQPLHADAVAAEIHQRAAVELWAQAHVS